MWPFKRKPAPPAPLNPGPINEDWKAGDLAECVESGEWISAETQAPVSGPEVGDVLSVVYVKPAVGIGGDFWFLRLTGIVGVLYRADAFRKVPPLNSEADAEFTAQIKRLKPSTVRA